MQAMRKVVQFIESFWDKIEKWDQQYKEYIAQVPRTDSGDRGFRIQCKRCGCVGKVDYFIGMTMFGGTNLVAELECTNPTCINLDTVFTAELS